MASARTVNETSASKNRRSEFELRRDYCMKPTKVPYVATRHRKIVTELPVPESIPILEKLAKYEPISMQGQPPIVIDKAKDCYVYDRWGNKWLDWSSGVLITNVGHSHPEILRAIRRVLDRPLLATYVFPHEMRAELAELLVSLAPSRRYRAFLLSTGSEATENCIKLAKTYGYKRYGSSKRYIISFENAFHGRTMGAQLAGGGGESAQWLGQFDTSFVRVPFPDGYRNEDTQFDLFLETLRKKGIQSKEVCGVISESFQGVGPDFFPKEYAQQLQNWCGQNDALLIIDEVQSGFGRTGKLFMFEHYGIAPDLIACGKGMSSSLPISAVIGREDVMNLYEPGSMTSTHSGSPLPVAAAIASIKLLMEGKILANVNKLDPILREGLLRIQRKHPDVAGCVHSLGLVGGIQVVQPPTKTPNRELAFAINQACFFRGLLMFSPVGVGHACIKIAPPLNISEDALMEGLRVLEQGFDVTAI